MLTGVAGCSSPTAARLVVAASTRQIRNRLLTLGRDGFERLDLALQPVVGWRRRWQAVRPTSPALPESDDASRPGESLADLYECQTGPMSKPSDEFTLVDSREGLAELAAAMTAAPEHAIDCEANSGFAYREEMCLLQVNVEERLWVVDLVALPREATLLDPLRPTLESETTVTLLHGGEYDVGLLRRDYGIQPAAIWDSPQANSLLGWPQTGYGSLVERICGVTLAKGHAFHDWARRPLAP